jgi:hypothetical protein
LKQLQLIQILCINARSVAALEQVAAKIPGVNRLCRAQTAQRRYPATRIPPFEVGQSGVLGGRRFTAR